MAKKNKKAGNSTPQVHQELKTTIADTKPSALPEQNGTGWLSFRFQAIIVALLAIVMYANTWQHEFALDDTIVIVKNEYVWEGFAGIKDILTKDAFDSYYRQQNSSNQLSGGRYRPLSIITFAIEQQLLGTDSVSNGNVTFEMQSKSEQKLLHDMRVRHVVNTLLYALAVVVLLYFLRTIIFRSTPVAAFIATLIFTAHPLHTEVVANVKSRDEILSLLFICLTFVTAFRYRADKKITSLALSMLCFLLAFLSKEYAIATVLLLPLAFVLFDKQTPVQSIKSFLPYLIVIGIYGLLRLQVAAESNPASDADILNNPYAFASPAEKLATQIATSLNYLKLLLVPYPLSSDYSYNTIPYKSFGHPMVWISLLVHAGIVGGIVYFFKRNRIICFGLAFYLFHLLLINNFLFNIGATMGERLAYHSSVGFAVIIAYLLYEGAQKIAAQNRAIVAAGVAGGIALVYCLIAIPRNSAWKNDYSLFLTDIKTSPNSALVNSNVGFYYLHQAESQTDSTKKRMFAAQALPYYIKATDIHKTFVIGYLNKGLCYFFMDQPDSARVNLEKVIQMYPNYANIHETFYNVGVNFYFHKRLPEAIEMWKTALRLKPDYILAQQSINTATIELNNANSAASK